MKKAYLEVTFRWGRALPARATLLPYARQTLEADDLAAVMERDCAG